MLIPWSLLARSDSSWCRACYSYDNHGVMLLMMMKMLLVRVVHLTVDSKLMINSFKPPDKN